MRSIARRKALRAIVEGTKAANGVCICQTATVRLDGALATLQSTTRIKTRHQGSPLPCRHWYVQDRTTGKITNERIVPLIGKQTRYGPSHAETQSQRSPWNTRGPASRFEPS